MDTQRLILFAAFMLVSMSLWQSWQIQVNPHPVVVNTTNSNAITDTPVPVMADNSQPKNDLPSVPANSSIESSTPIVSKTMSSGKRISVKTNVFDIEIQTRKSINGGTLINAAAAVPYDIKREQVKSYWETCFQIHLLAYTVKRVSDAWHNSTNE